MIVVPAIDLIEGRCVRLRQGRFEERTDYAVDPLEVARAYRDAGLTHLHVVDLDGARQGRPVQLGLVERLVRESGLTVDLGGGLRTAADLDQALATGIAQANLGSAAVRSPDLLLEALARFGPERIILSADVRDGRVATHGWQQDSGLALADLVARFRPAGLAWVLCTDIGRDGMLTGPALDLYAGLLGAFPGLGLIASGGVGSSADLAALAGLGLPRAVVGKALYEGRISLAELGPYAH